VILVDTAVWADHIVRPETSLMKLLDAGEIAIHPFVIGELALGNLRDRRVLSVLARLPSAPVAFESEVLMFIERHALHGSGIGYVDAHLWWRSVSAKARRSGRVTAGFKPPR
jgi:predicted nucleic acid-binding protein